MKILTRNLWKLIIFILIIQVFPGLARSYEVSEQNQAAPVADPADDEGIERAVDITEVETLDIRNLVPVQSLSEETVYITILRKANAQDSLRAVNYETPF